MNVVAHDAVNPYESPREPAVLAPSWRWRAFTPLVRWSVLALLIGPIVVAMLGAPAAGVGIWFALSGQDSAGCWLGSAAGVAVAIPLVFLWYSYIPMWGNRWIERRLARIWEAKGIDAAACGGRFVELALSDEPRLYHEGSTNWDVGFLLLTSDRMVYLGDCTSWSIGRQQIQAMRIGVGSFERLHPRHVFIRWQPEHGDEPGVFSFAPTEGPTLTASQASVGALAERIGRWWRVEVAGLAQLPASMTMPCEPQLAEVSSRSQAPHLYRTRCMMVVAAMVAVGFIAIEISQLASGRQVMPHWLLAMSAGGSAMGAWLGAVAAWPRKAANEADSIAHASPTS
jgi:hypothetical protein